MGKKKGQSREALASVTSPGPFQPSAESLQDVKRFLHLREIEALVLQMREDGADPDNVVEELRKKGITAYRNPRGKITAIQNGTISTITNQALKSGRLRYFPEQQETLEREIASFNPTLRLENISVVESAHGRHIAEKGAASLLRIMESHKTRHGADSNEIRIGFFGGKTPSDLMRCLATTFSRLKNGKDLDRYPRRITFFSLVGSFPTSRISVDPNAYFTFFPSEMPEGHPQFDFQFASLPVTGLVTPQEHADLSKFLVVQEAMAERMRLDVICGSCGHWGPGHHSSYDYVRSACGETLLPLWDETATQLTKSGVIGDFCWSPINADGPINVVESPLRLFTALNFDELCGFVHPKNLSRQRFGKLLLLVSPCYGAECQKITKGEVLESILHSTERPPVTHLVVDSATAREYCMRFKDSNRPQSG